MWDCITKTVTFLSRNKDIFIHRNPPSDDINWDKLTKCLRAPMIIIHKREKGPIPEYRDSRFFQDFLYIVIEDEHCEILSDEQVAVYAGSK